MTRFASLALALLLSACASTPPETSHYLLRSDEDIQSRVLQPSEKFALGTVTIAPYIDQPGLVLQTQNGDMRPARHHLWAEPLFEGARTYLRAEISRISGQDLAIAALKPNASVIDVRIDQMHGTHDGKAKLVAYWWLRQSGDLQAAHQFAQTRVLGSDGYAALAAAEKALLTALATEIAAALGS